MKICKKCNTDNELSEFNKHPKNRDGLDDRCKLCRKEYYKQYQLNNKEKIKEISKQHRENNKEKYHQKSKQWYLDNKEYCVQKSTQYIKDRKQVDPLFKLRHLIGILVSKSFRNKGIKKNTKTEQILGCTINEFINHLQSQFITGMSLENHGLVWEIDHITPMSSAKTEEDIITLNHYINLRPLFKTTEIAEQYGHNIVGNRNKGNKII
jgi:hypothetical protein